MRSRRKPSNGRIDGRKRAVSPVAGDDYRLYAGSVAQGRQNHHQASHFVKCEEMNSIIVGNGGAGKLSRRLAIKL